MRFDTVIFDLDGTILDTLEDLKTSLNFALGKFAFPERTTDEVRKFVGNGIRKLIERGAPQGLDEAELNNIHEAFTKHYTLHCADETKPYDGVCDVIRALREAGVKTAVVSNKADYAVKSLCERYFKGLFDCAAGEKEGVRRKPSPDAVNLILRRLGAEKALYVGDSEVDIETAKNASLEALIVTWGFRDEEFLKSRGAVNIARVPEDILKYCM